MSIWFACPVCGSDRQSFHVLASWRRRSQATCKSCGARIDSELKFGVYLLLLFYMHLLLLFLALPFLWSIFAQAWLITVAVVLIFWISVTPIFMIWHARNVTRPTTGGQHRFGINDDVAKR